MTHGSQQLSPGSPVLTQGFACYSIYACADGRQLTVAALEPKFFQRLCALVGRPELADDPRYDTNPKRVARRAEVDALLNEALATKTVAEWDAILERYDVPHAPILKVSEVLANPQVKARGMVSEYEHPRLGTFPALGRAIRFPDHEGVPLQAPPLLGEDDERVLGGLLGYSPDRIAELRRAGVIGGASEAGPATTPPAAPSGSS